MRVLIMFFCILILPCSLQAEEYWKQTQILNFTDDIPKSETARDFQGLGYELAGGDFQSFEDWYARDHFSLYVEAITPLDPNFALHWGVSTGEAGEKYEIDPALKLGFRYVWALENNAELLFFAHHMFGGDFREKACVADYGEIGGVQNVNCRLAASELASEDTLEYLVRDQSEAWGVGFEFDIRF